MRSTGIFGLETRGKDIREIEVNFIQVIRRKHTFRIENIAINRLSAMNFTNIL